MKKVNWSVAMLALVTAATAGATELGGREVPNGGDGCELLVTALAREMVLDLKGPLGKHFPEVDVNRLETAVETVEIECVDSPKRLGRDREALNYFKGRKVQAAKKRFGYEMSRLIQKPLLLHEFLPLIEVRDDRYSVSERYARLLPETGQFVAKKHMAVSATFDVEAFEKDLDSIAERAKYATDLHFCFQAERGKNPLDPYTGRDRVELHGVVVDQAEMNRDMIMGKGQTNCDALIQAALEAGLTEDEIVQIRMESARKPHARKSRPQAQSSAADLAHEKFEQLMQMDPLDPNYSAVAAEYESLLERIRAEREAALKSMDEELDGTLARLQRARQERLAVFKPLKDL